MTETKNKERKVGESGQYLVTVRKRKEWKRLFRYLTENGYANVHSLSVLYRPTRPPVVVVDERQRIFFLTNVTCLAASASCGKKSIPCETYLSFRIFEQKTKGVPVMGQQKIDDGSKNG